MTAAPAPSLIAHTMAKARRAIAVALCGALALIGLMLAERAWQADVTDRALQRLLAAERATAQVLLADEQLTMSAFMAAATGDERWVQRYHHYLPGIDAAIAASIALAPADVAQRFDAQTAQSNTRLVAMEEASFKVLAAGQRAQAWALLDGPAYHADKQLLSAGTAEFAAGLKSAVAAELADVQHQGRLVGTLVFVLSCVGAALAWRGLSQSLEVARAVHQEAEERIHRLANTDPLTGLANRVALRAAMHHSLARAAREGQSLSLLMIDLDRFKPVNDRHGHAMGDLVLKEVARRLGQVLRQGELQARYGGDEFVVLVHEQDAAPAYPPGSPPGSVSVALAVAERIIKALGEPITLDNNTTVQIGASVGVAHFGLLASPGHPGQPQTEHDLLYQADLALYHAKASGRNAVREYDPSLAASQKQRDELEQALGGAIASGQLVPYYQPMVDLPNGRPMALEVLCRWLHPHRGVLLPADFISLAETSGHMPALTVSLLRQACTDLRGFAPNLRLSINVSAGQIQDPTLAAQLLAVLKDTGTDPRRIEVELTENALVADIVSARHTIGLLKAAGLTVALDDFGTGYSSLSYLSDMAFDKIKIDRSFVRALQDGTAGQQIVGAIIGLSASLGVQVVAEGVETAADAQTLLGLGCVKAQGYYFARPLPAAGLREWARRPAQAVALTV